MSPIPMLLVGDGPDKSTGLARILRDLATVLTSSPHFRVGTLGYKALGSARLPFQQYSMSPCEDQTFALQGALPIVWDDFTRGTPGIIMTIWDASRLLWLARPDLIVGDTGLREWLLSMRSKSKVWGYFPFDSEGPHGKLTAETKATLMGYDRILACSPFGEQVILNTIGPEAAFAKGLTWLPHGLGEGFKP